MGKIKIKTIWGTIECSHTNIKNSYDGESLIVKTNVIDLRIPNKDLLESVKSLYTEKNYAFWEWEHENK